MLIQGEKYACEACVRGHRVSNCQHSDRPLTHINKKGRPVSQCAHCRTLRKSRSAHVKCDCGEKIHTKPPCTHFKDAEIKNELLRSAQNNSATQSEDAGAESCCCSHGGRCSCSLKKEPLDTVPESDSDQASSSTPSSETRRPRAHTVQSDGPGMTVFTNGHHKPAHKHNQMAHKCGLPYVVPRAHSIHGLSSTGLANRSVDSLPHTSTVEALHSESHIKDSIVSAQQEQRMIKSEHNSPLMGSTLNLELLNGQLPPLDLSSLDNFSNNYNLTLYDGLSSMPDIEAPMFSAGLSAASIDWSHYDGLDFNNDSFATTSAFSQAPSFTGFDFSSIDQPALTRTSTSGEISEVEDFVQYNDMPQVPPNLAASQQYGSDYDASDLGESERYRLSTASSYVGVPRAQTNTGNDMGSLEIDEFIKGVTRANANYQSNNSSVDVLSMAGFGEESKFIPSANDQFDANTFPVTTKDLDNTSWGNMDDISLNGNSKHQNFNLWPQ